MSKRGRAILSSILFIIFIFVTSDAVPSEEYDSFAEWARANPSYPFPAQQSQVFGTVIDSFPSSNLIPVGLAYDAEENGLWLANEDGGELLLISADPLHNVIRSINIQDFHLTADGNQDGVAVIGDNLYLTDFQGDQYISDDLIFQVDRVTGELRGWWHVDGLQNPNQDASINMILGISDDGAGNFWVTDNEANLHNVSLLPGGEWVQNSVQTVPGGGIWAGIDYDTCLEEFFTVDMENAVVNHHIAMPAPPTISAAAAGPDVSGVTSDNNGTIWTVGRGNGMIYVHTGIACSVPVQPMTWGTIKALFR